MDSSRGLPSSPSGLSQTSEHTAHHGHEGSGRARARDADSLSETGVQGRGEGRGKGGGREEEGRKKERGREVKRGPPGLSFLIHRQTGDSKEDEAAGML